MTTTLRSALRAAVVAALTAGCNTAPPGAGFTNGVDPATISNPETSAVRSDLPVPAPVTNPDEPLAEAAASSPATAGNDAGTGGRGGGQVGNARPATGAGSRPAGAAPAKASPASPAKVEAAGENGAQGGTKPPGNIQEGNPRSPQL